MPTTRDRAKLGTTTYEANIGGWKGDDPVTLKTSPEFATEEEARAWVIAEAPLADPSADSASVFRGTYVAEDFEDEEFGTIYDATWEQDDGWALYGNWSDPAAIEWEQG